jgi:hypothetical protein
MNKMKKRKDRHRQKKEKNRYRLLDCSQMYCTVSHR